MLTVRRVIALVCIVVFLGACAWVSGWLHPVYQAEAELRVRPRSAMELMVMGQDPDHAAVDDRLTIAQEAGRQIRSREVITEALRVMKDHPIILAQADPEDFVARRLDVEVIQPGIILVRMSHQQDPTFCADLVNAIIDGFKSSAENKLRVQQVNEIEGLEQHVAELKDSYRRQASALEHLRQSLQSSHGSRSGKSVGSEFLKVKVEQLKLAANRTSERLLDERLSSADVRGHQDQENASDSQRSAADDSDASGEAKHLEKSKRLQEEYERLMADLEKSLELLAAQAEVPSEEIGSSRFALDEAQREAERLSRQVDEANSLLAKTKAIARFEPRMEVVSRAVTPVSRRRGISLHTNPE